MPLTVAQMIEALNLMDPAARLAAITPHGSYIFHIKGAEQVDNEDGTKMVWFMLVPNEDHGAEMRETLRET